MFTHLHVHTQYSMLDGAMYGALEFYTKAKKAGLRPIVGCELYISETDHLIHDKSAGHNFHLVLLAFYLAAAQS